ncbi:heme exporter protein CcmD [Pantoea sp. Mb-10]|uniref:heme exporter protein CcmD n=1 Tax=unclassified Pantoea TaxID=2630326 RepID=UPI001E498E61|nr:MULTISPECIES: heme exporter protein CcmD [unclassified Pantoea]MCE0489299.1 heme exporter protein CcmD [Pantoea sp. Mb-10]MCE0501827.1 heme exporter protein CcmD [Pantoea sp. Pb-8]
MTPAFTSWQAFFAMGGYAFYVWLAVAMTLIALVSLLLHTVVQRRRILAEVRMRHAREHRMRTARQQQAARSAGEAG